MISRLDSPRCRPPRHPAAMSRRITAIRGVALGLALSAAAMATALASAAEPQGYRLSLFDGKSLDGWVVTGCQAGVEDGSLVLQGGDGLVRSAHRYGDFVLDLDWKARQASAYDSGIYFRAELPSGKSPWPARYQINLLQGKEGNVAALPGAASTGLVKAGQWNHFRLTVVGRKASLEINGQPAWSVEGVEPLAGYIGLQSEVAKGGQFEFRNFEITELGHRSLFDGRDLATDWEGAGAAADLCWRVDNGLLLCTGQKGPWLRSKSQVGDFNLRLEYRLKEGGNSGVFVRVPLDGAHRPGANSGVEIQCLDDASERYRTIKPYQFSASVYGIVPAEPRVSKPAGQWNQMEINCQGTAYRITHNGQVVVDATESKFPELAQRLVRGYLGLQNHSEEVWFRHLRLGPPLE